MTNLLAGYSNTMGSREKNKQIEKTQWKWGKQEQHAFDILKKNIDITLAYAEIGKPFCLGTDASRTGIGAVLEQQHESVWKLVALASRRTSCYERNYPTPKLEFLAL